MTDELPSCGGGATGGKNRPTEEPKKPEFEFWIKRDLWSMEEAIHLLTEVDPYNPHGDYHHKVRKQLENTRQKYWALIQDAIVVRALYPINKHSMQFKPKEFLRWADSKEIPIPSELQPLLFKEEDNTAAISEAATKQENEKQLTSRERDNLYRTIGALAVMVIEAIAFQLFGFDNHYR